MKVTVKDCLELRAFKGARVVAGRAALGNDVKAVSGSYRAQRSGGLCRR